MSRVYTLVLPLPQAYFIWYFAWLSVPSAIYAYTHTETTHFALIPTALWASSILYWRNPIHNSWRRNLDMIVVSTGLTHHICYAVTTPGIDPFITRTYLSLIGISIMFYVVSQYYLLFIISTQLLVGNIHTCNDPPRRQYREFCTLLWHK